MSARRTAKILAASTFFFASIASSFASCDGKTCEEGGGIVIDGKCEGKCDPAKCLPGNTCVSNRCVLKCEAETDCDPDQACTAAKTDSGKDVTVCTASDKDTDIGTPCPLGTECDALTACPDGTPCTGDASDACPAAQCRPLSCVTTGVGDGNAYCAAQDCTKDDDCPGGYFCSVHRLPTQICGTTKGTGTPCIDPSTFTDDAATNQEGPVSLLRNVCRKRQDCAPCDSDIDCSLTAGQKCTMIGGANVCAPTCAKAADCGSDQDCSADGVCVQKFMACTGSGNFCEPCVTDLDCAGGGAAQTCVGIDTMRACVDESFSTSCTSSAQCPVSPGGKHGTCLDATEGVQPTDSVYHKCFFPFSTTTMTFSCW